MLNKIFSSIASAHIGNNILCISPQLKILEIIIMKRMTNISGSDLAFLCFFPEVLLLLFFCVCGGGQGGLREDSRTSRKYYPRW